MQPPYNKFRSRPNKNPTNRIRRNVIRLNEFTHCCSRQILPARVAVHFVQEKRRRQKNIFFFPRRQQFGQRNGALKMLQSVLVNKPTDADTRTHYPIARYARNIKGLQIYKSAAQIQKIGIARAILEKDM